MTRIVDAAALFTQRKCRPGSLAMHANHGVVRVVQAVGSMRKIEVDRYEVCDAGESSAEEKLLVSELDVLVTELSELIPFVDMEPPVPGRLLRHSSSAR